MVCVLALVLESLMFVLRTNVHIHWRYTWFSDYFFGFNNAKCNMLNCKRLRDQLIKSTRFIGKWDVLYKWMDGWMCVFRSLNKHIKLILLLHCPLFFEKVFGSNLICFSQCGLHAHT